MYSQEDEKCGDDGKQYKSTRCDLEVDSHCDFSEPMSSVD